MHRREALKTGTALLGIAVAASSACERGARGERSGVLGDEDVRLMEDVADTLLPDTPASPGAKAAGAGPAIQLLLTDCYEPEAQRRVISGLSELRDRCRARTGLDFGSVARRDREQLLREIDAEASTAAAPHWFHLVRELAERAYFSSEVGMTKALRYVRVPGHFDGCVPLAKGQPAWG